MEFISSIDIGVTMGLLLAWPVLALALAYRLFDFPDLTVEGSFPLGAAIYAVLAKNGAPLFLSLFACILGAGLAGAFTGFLHCRFRVNKFLSGILLVAICYSLSLRTMGASNIGLLGIGSLFELPGSATLVKYGWNSLPTQFILIGILVAVLVLVSGVLTSKWGLHLRIAGCNPAYAETLGVSVSWKTVSGLFCTNAFSGVGGAFLAMHQGFVDVSMGQGILILALASLTIGERLLPKSISFPIFVMLAAIFGSIVYQLIVAVAVQMGLSATDLKLATAVIVLLVIALRMTDEPDLFTNGGAR